MSHAVDEYYTIYEEPIHRARKAHICDACRETISPGHRYARVFMSSKARSRR